MFFSVPREVSRKGTNMPHHNALIAFTDTSNILGRVCLDVTAIKNPISFLN